MNAKINFPCSTGTAASLANTTEPRFADVVRRGKIDPPPPVVAGRRLWYPGQIRQAAESIGLITAELEALLAEAELDREGGL